MGNRPPLPPPPSPSPQKVVVWSVSTRSKLCGFHLCVLSKDAYRPCGDDEVVVNGSRSGADEQVTQEEDDGTADDVSGSTGKRSDADGSSTQPSTVTSNNNLFASLGRRQQQHSSSIQTDSKVPSILQAHTDLSLPEWQAKVDDQFANILQSWKGGIARTLLMVWASLVVLCFIAAYMIPDFWVSTIFTKPWALLGLCSTQIVLFTVLLWYSRKETHRVLTETRDLFRPWRRQYGINVTFYQVANIILSDECNTRRRSRRTKQQYAGSYCFVLAFTLVPEEDVEAMELASLGTARDDDEMEAETFDEQD